MSLDYESLNDVEKRYVFAVVPQLDDLSPTQMDNFSILCDKLNQLDTLLINDGRTPLAIRNGYLDSSQVYESSLSLDAPHMVCAAVDLDDFDGSLYGYLINNDILNMLDIYVVDNSYTAGYVHFQVSTPPGGLRVFTP